MPRLSKITITQFKNYDLASYVFSQNVVGICGLNGMGKTNLLDAIYYLCFTKSYFSSTDTLNINFGKEGFRLEGAFSNHKVVCVYRGAGKKEFSLDDIPYTKFSEHIGRFPAVMVAPDDVELISGSSEERRRYIDTILSQTDKTYLQQLIQYNKVLQQRNSLLKRFAETGNTDWQLLDVVDEQLMQPGNYIFQQRKELSTALMPMVQQYYQEIARNEERVTLEYETQLNQSDFYTLLNDLRQKDFILQRSNGGIHKDDILISLNGQTFKNTASQGQRKSLLFALKLAEFELLKQNKQEAPVLLLDDVFEKLDDNRMQQLLNRVCIQNDGQVFITDTHPERLEAALNKLSVPFQMIKLTPGVL